MLELFTGLKKSKSNIVKIDFHLFTKQIVISMESLPTELVKEICTKLSGPDLKQLTRCSKLYRDIYGKFLEENRKKQLQFYLQKYAQNDSRLIQMMTTLFNDRYPCEDYGYCCMIIPEQIFEVPSNSRFLLFKGNFSIAIFKIADYLWENIGKWSGPENIEYNIFYEVLYQRKDRSAEDLNDVGSVIDFFFDFKEGSEIGIDKFYYLPKIEVI